MEARQVKRFTNILFVAGSDDDDSAAHVQAVKLANNNQAALTLVDVVDVIPAERRMATTVMTPQELCDMVATEKREKLRQIIETAGDTKIAVDAKVLIGKPFI
jgi:hypothetical protein